MPDWYSVTIETEGPTPSVEALEALSETLEDLGAHGPAVGSGGPSGGIAVTFAVDAGDQGDDAARALAEACRWSLETLVTATEKAGVPWDRLATLEVLTDAQFQRKLNEEPERFAGVTEVAEMLGVSKQRIRELRRLEGFPAPVEELAAGPVWSVSSLRRFVRDWPRRPGRPAHLADELERLMRDRRWHDVLLEEKLTERERELLQQVMQGRPIREIAEALDVSNDAVRSSLRRISTKLGVHPRPDAG